jgi:hypothetical protein
LAADLAHARLATARYATDLDAAQADCAAASPDAGSSFVFWHPNLDGLFASMNPLIAPSDAPLSHGEYGGSARSFTAL